MFKELNNFDVTIDVIPKTIEKYMSIIVNRSITFINSLQFIKASLDTLTSNLEDNDFKYLMSEFPIDKLEILKRKDAYPYEWVDSYKKFNYQQLPPKKHFYSSIKDGKEMRAMDMFLMSNIYTYKMFGMHLILIHLKPLTIIT